MPSQHPTFNLVTEPASCEAIFIVLIKKCPAVEYFSSLKLFQALRRDYKTRNTFIFDKYFKNHAIFLQTLSYFELYNLVLKFRKYWVNKCSLMHNILFKKIVLLIFSKTREYFRMCVLNVLSFLPKYLEHILYCQIAVNFLYANKYK